MLRWLYLLYLLNLVISECNPMAGPLEESFKLENVCSCARIKNVVGYDAMVTYFDNEDFY